MDITPTYYPKRTAEDGIIFWDKDSIEIYNLIRAVTKPFHGAFTFYNDNKIMIWNGYPFDSRLFDPYILHGTILHLFSNGDIILKTGDGSFIITEYELHENIKLRARGCISFRKLSIQKPLSISFLTTLRLLCTTRSQKFEMPTRQ